MGAKKRVHRTKQQDVSRGESDRDGWHAPVPTLICSGVAGHHHNYDCCGPPSSSPAFPRSHPLLVAALTAPVSSSTCSYRAPWDRC